MVQDRWSLLVALALPVGLAGLGPPALAESSQCEDSGQGEARCAFPGWCTTDHAIEVSAVATNPGGLALVVARAQCGNVVVQCVGVPSSLGDLSHASCTNGNDLTHGCAVGLPSTFQCLGGCEAWGLGEVQVACYAS